MKSRIGKLSCKALWSVTFLALILVMLSWSKLARGQGQDTNRLSAVSATATSTAAASSASTYKALPTPASLVFIMRHAIAPGTGDPPGFRLDDCATQRNLSNEGIRQAQDIGKRLNANGMAPSTIWSSQWCRALDTANNLGLGPVKPLPALNSFFSQPGQGAEQMKTLERFIADLDPAKGPYIMVTHQVVVTTLTGVFPASGEGVWIRLTGDRKKPWVVQGDVALR